MEREIRACWQNCYVPDDPRFLEDEELVAIDTMEDALAPLDATTVQLRRWITRFEACYLEADREAEAIIRGIGKWHCPEPISERPARRREELASSSWILSAWCEDPEVRGLKAQLDDMAAEELLGYLGEPNPLKLWQVARVVDRIRQGLDANHHYFPLALDKHSAELHYKEDLEFLQQTQALRIRDTLDGQPSEVSLAFAIDLLMPCHWDFVGSLVTLIKAIGGDLRPDRPYTCCARNLYLSPLCDRLRNIAQSLHAYGTDESPPDRCDPALTVSLGEATPAKRWLVASLDKTIRLQLETPFSCDLV